MPRATALLASAALASLLLVTACEPDGSGDSAGPSRSRGPATERPSASATVVGGHAASGVPDAAWIPARDLPLDSAYHWKDLAGVAFPEKAPVFQSDLCGTRGSTELADMTEGAFVARAALAPGGAQDWQMQETLVNWPGTTNGPIQTSAALFRGVTDKFKNCAAPEAKVKVAVDDGHRFAATVTTPRAGGTTLVLHEYLVDNSGTVAELSVWTEGHPKAAWAAADGAVLKSLDAPLCSAFKDC